MAAERINEQLKTLAAEGAFDSEGQFTLDPAKSLAKIRGFQLADPRQWVLSLLAAAMAGSASQVQFTIDSGGINFSADAESLSQDQLRSLFSFEGAASSEKHLAIALNAAAGLPYKTLVFESGQTRMSIQDGKIAIKEDLAKPINGWRLAVKLEAGFFGSLFNSTDDIPELEYLTKRCSLAPLAEFSINRRPGRYGLQLHPCLAYSVAQSPSGPRPGAVRSERGIRWERTLEKPISYVLALGELEPGASATIIRHGVSFEVGCTWSLPLRAYVWLGDELRLDASQQSIVQDAAWQALLQHLEREAYLLAEHWLAHNTETTDDFQDIASKVCELLLVWSRREGREVNEDAAKAHLRRSYGSCHNCGGVNLEVVPMLAGGEPLEADRKGVRLPVKGVLCCDCGGLRMQATL